MLFRFRLPWAVLFGILVFSLGRFRPGALPAPLPARRKFATGLSKLGNIPNATLKHLSCTSAPTRHRGQCASPSGRRGHHTSSWWRRCLHHLPCIMWRRRRSCRRPRRLAQSRGPRRRPGGWRHTIHGWQVVLFQLATQSLLPARGSGCFGRAMLFCTAACVPKHGQIMICASPLSAESVESENLEGRLRLQTHQQTAHHNSYLSSMHGVANRTPGISPLPTRHKHIVVRNALQARIFKVCCQSWKTHAAVQLLERDMSVQSTCQVQPARPTDCRKLR